MFLLLCSSVMSIWLIWLSVFKGHVTIRLQVGPFGFYLFHSLRCIQIIFITIRSHILSEYIFSFYHFSNELFSVFDDIIILFRYCNGFELSIILEIEIFKIGNVSMYFDWMESNTFVSFCSGQNWWIQNIINTLSKKSTLW